MFLSLYNLGRIKTARLKKKEVSYKIVGSESREVSMDNVNMSDTQKETTSNSNSQKEATSNSKKSPKSRKYQEKTSYLKNNIKSTKTRNLADNATEIIHCKSVEDKSNAYPLIESNKEERIMPKSNALKKNNFTP